MYFQRLKIASYTIGILNILLSCLFYIFLYKPGSIYFFHYIDIPIIVLIGLFLLMNILLLYGILKKKSQILFIWSIFTLILTVSMKDFKYIEPHWILWKFWVYLISEIRKCCYSKLLYTGCLITE